MLDWLKDRIVSHLAQHGYRPVKTSQLRKDLKISHDQFEVFNQALSGLLLEEKIEKESRGSWALPDIPEEIAGQFVRTRRGFGFVESDVPYKGGALFIEKGDELDAIHGDRVIACPSFRKRGMRRIRGRVIKVIERGQTRFTGVLEKDSKGWKICPDGKFLDGRVLVHDVSAKGATVGDKVYFELVHWPRGDWLAEGVIVDVLGKAGLPSIEEKSIILAHGFRVNFDVDQQEQASKSSQNFEKRVDPFKGDREDCTSMTVFTIDPPDARDFDDAISVEKDSVSGFWELGVHIADVSSFVPQGSPVDLEAALRSNSVYLPRRVIPMIPEVLSNGVCSLQEGVVRWTKSVFIKFDQKGNVVGQRFAATKIKSKKRFTYLEAQSILDGDPSKSVRYSKNNYLADRSTIESLKKMKALTDVLLSRRRLEGMIELDLPESDLEFDLEGHVVNVFPEDQSFTHRMIEMCMIEANEAVARLFYNIKVPILRRVHPEPVSGDFEALSHLADSLGYQMGQSVDKKDLQWLLNKTRQTPAARGVHFAVLRTMTRAEYKPSIVGHWALASSHYAHFTSPIRRYADLLVHRALTAWLEKTNNGKVILDSKEKNLVSASLRDDDRLLDEVVLSDIGSRCSFLERNAEDAERSLRLFLILQYLEKEYLGKELDSFITGFNRFTVQMILDKYLIPVEVLHDDLNEGSSRSGLWSYIENVGKLVQVSSRQFLRVGDRIVIQLTHVDLVGRSIGVRVVSLPQNRASKNDCESIERFLSNKFSKTRYRRKKRRDKKSG